MKESFVIDLGDAKEETKGVNQIGCEPDGLDPEVDGYAKPLSQC